VFIELDLPIVTQCWTNKEDGIIGIFFLSIIFVSILSSFLSQWCISYISLSFKWLSQGSYHRFGTIRTIHSYLHQYFVVLNGEQVDVFFKVKVKKFQNWNTRLLSKHGRKANIWNTWLTLAPWLKYTRAHASYSRSRKHDYSDRRTNRQTNSLWSWIRWFERDV